MRTSLKPRNLQRNNFRPETSAAQQHKGRVTPSQLPVFLEIPSINASLLHAPEASSQQKLAGVTATIGLALGWGEKEGIAVDLFPVYLKVDLDKADIFGAFVSGLKPTDGDAPVAGAEAGPPPSILKTLAVLPDTVAIACEGAVVEFSKADLTLLSVVESVLLELDTRSPSRSDESVLKVRGVLKSATATCLSNCGRQTKAVYVKSAAVNAECCALQIDGGAEKLTPLVLSVAVATLQVDLKDPEHGILVWAKMVAEMAGPPNTADSVGGAARAVALPGVFAYNLELLDCKVLSDLSALRSEADTLPELQAQASTSSFTLGCSRNSQSGDVAVNVESGEIAIELSEVVEGKEGKECDLYRLGSTSLSRVSFIIQVYSQSEVPEDTELTTLPDVAVELVIVQPQCALSPAAIKSALVLLTCAEPGRNRPVATGNGRQWRLGATKIEVQALDTSLVLVADKAVPKEEGAPAVRFSLQSLEALMEHTPARANVAPIARPGSFPLGKPTTLGTTVVNTATRLCCAILPSYDIDKSMRVPELRSNECLLISTCTVTVSNGPPSSQTSSPIGFATGHPLAGNDFEVNVSIPQLAVNWNLYRLRHSLVVAKGWSALSQDRKSLVRRGGADNRGTVEAEPVVIDGIPERDFAIAMKVDVGVAKITLRTPATRTTTAVEPSVEGSESCPMTDFLLKLSTTRVHAVYISGAEKDASTIKVTTKSGAARVGGVEVLLLDGISVSNDAPPGLLDATRGRCQTHSDHPASPEHLNFANRSTSPEDGRDSARPDESTAWWFREIDNSTDDLWRIDANTINIFHPHDFNFGLYIEQLQNMQKASLTMLRQIMSPGKKSNGVMLDGPNLLLRFGQISLEIEDDPFEARLYLGHRLRCEETVEQVKRSMLLEARMKQIVDELTNTSGESIFLDPEWVATMKAALLKENSGIYCMRAAQLKKAANDASLVTLTLSNFEFGLMPDHRLGTEARVAQAVGKLDPAAKIPDSVGSSFLFARRIFAKLGQIDACVRRFPRKPLLASDVEITGVFILQGLDPWDQEQERLSRSVDLGPDLPTISRDGMPLHVYHGLRVDAGDISYAWGPCYDPPIQQVVLKLDLMLSRGIMAGPASGVTMAWYDKLRQLRHGPIELTSKKFTLSLMAGQDPNIESNSVELRFFNIATAWNNSNLDLQADLELVIFPKNRFYGCPVFTLADVRAGVTLLWCPSGGGKYLNSHHEPDSAKFKSDGVDIGLSFSISDRNNSSACLLYAETIAWLSRVYTDMFIVDRPRIKRGNLWRKTPPPKVNTLGQHATTVTLDLNLAELVVLYFNDLNRQFGMRLNSNQATYSTVYNQVAAADDERASPAGRQVSEWQYASETWDLSTVEVIVLSRAGEDGITGRFKRGENEKEDSNDGEDSDSDDEDLDFELLITDLASEVLKDEIGDAPHTKRSPLFTATLISYNRGVTTRKVDLNRRRTSSDTRSNKNNPAWDRRASSSIIRDESFIHMINVQDLKMVYSRFTADIMFATFNSYADRNFFRFDLSPEALSPHAFAAAAAERLQVKRSSVHAGDMDMSLGMLVEDAKTNFEAKAGDDVDPANVAPDPREQIYRDVNGQTMRLKFNRPQIQLRGPNTDMPLVMVSENARVDILEHDPVQKRGKIHLKDSWSFFFRKMAYFTTTDAWDPKRLLWIPTEYVQLFDDTEDDVFVESKELCRITPPHELEFISVYHTFDERLGPVEKPRVTNLNRTDAEPLAAKDEHPDIFFYQINNLDMTVTATQWVGVLDIINNVIIVEDSIEVEKLQEIELIKLRSAVSEDENQTIEAKIEAAREYIMRLQMVVREFKNTYDVVERQLASAHRSGAMDDETLESQERVDYWFDEWIKNKKLYDNARNELRTRVMALHEFLLNPVEHKGRHYWNVRYDVALDFCKLKFVDNNDKKICETRMNSILYRWNWHNSGFGEQKLECPFFEVLDLINYDGLDGGAPRAVIKQYGQEDGGRIMPDGFAVRVYALDAATIGGIPVTEHFEVNLVPIEVTVRQNLVDAVAAFLFPEVSADDPTKNSSGTSSTGLAVIRSESDGDNELLGQDGSQRQDSTTSTRHLAAAAAAAAAMAPPTESTTANTSVAPPRQTGRGYRHSRSGSGPELQELNANARRQSHRRTGSASDVGGLALESNSLRHLKLSGRRSPASSTESLDAVRNKGSPLSMPPVAPQRRHRRSKSFTGAPASDLTAKIFGSTSEETLFAEESDPAGRFAAALDALDALPKALDESKRSSSLTLLADPNGGGGGSQNGGGGGDGPPPVPRLQRRGSLKRATTERGDAMLTGRRGSIGSGASRVRDDVTKGKGAAMPDPSPSYQRRSSMTSLKDLRGFSKSTLRMHTADAQVATMTSRSQTHRTFICIKVPSFTACITYLRGEGDKKTMADLRDVVIALPPLEYHDQTCTIKALLDQIRADTVGHVVAAVLKRKVLGLKQDDKLERTILPTAMDGDGAAPVAVRESLLFGDAKSVAKMEKRQEKALKKLEKKEQALAKKEGKKKLKEEKKKQKGKAESPVPPATGPS